MLKLGTVNWWLVATFLLLVAGCSSGDKEMTADDLIRTTRIAAEVTGVLVEQDGCLRLAQDASSDSPSKAIVWQKDVFEIERSDDEVRIRNVNYGDGESRVVWKIGERVRTSGGEFHGREFHASEEFLQRCVGPYVFVSGAWRDSEPVLSE